MPATMKLKLEGLFRGFVIALLAILLWSVWQSEAQTNSTGGTNAASTTQTAQAAPEKPTLTQQILGVTPDITNQPATPPEWVEQMTDRFPFLERKFFDNALWKYLFSLVYIFLAFYVSKLLDFLTRIWLKRWTQRTKTTFDDLALQLLNGPVRIVSFVILLRIGLEVFTWPPVVQIIMAKAFAVIVAATITYTVLKLVDLLMGFWHLRVAQDADKEFNEQLFPILRKTLKVFVVIVATLVTLSNIGVNVTAAIASLSVGGLALGLAAQDTVANVFGAVSVFIDKPFRIGDRIQLDAVDGVVESIGMRSTRVRNLDGHLITVPNKTMGNATITNVTRRPNIKTIMDIGVTYDTPMEKLRRAIDLLKETYQAHPKTSDLIVSFNQFAASSLNIRVIHWYNSTDYKEYLDGIQELNLRIKEQFDAEGISFAFPTQTIYMKQDSEWKLGQAEAAGRGESA